MKKKHIQISDESTDEELSEEDEELEELLEFDLMDDDF